MIITNPVLPFGIFPVPFLTEFMAPAKVQISYVKDTKSSRNLGGYTFAHWGDQPDNFQVSGTVALLPGRETLCLLALQVLKVMYKLDKKKINNILGVASKVLSTTALTAASVSELLGKGEQHYKNLTSGSNALDIANDTLDILMKGFSIQQYIEQVRSIKDEDLSSTYIYFDNFLYKGFFTRFSYTRDASNPRIVNYEFSFTVEWSSENYFQDYFLKKNQIISSLQVLA